MRGRATISNCCSRRPLERLVRRPFETEMAPGTKPIGQEPGPGSWRSQGKSKKVLKSIRLPISDLPSPPLSCNGHFDNWQTSLSWRMGCRSGMPSSQERAGRRPQKAKVTRSNRVGCARFHWGRRRESRTLPRKRDGSIGFPFDGGCWHTLNRAVANASFWIGRSAHQASHLPRPANILRFGWRYPEVIFRMYRGV